MFSKATFTVLLLAAIALFNLPGQSAAEEGLNEAQKKEVEKTIQDYILKNPEIILQSIRDLQVRQQSAEKDLATQNLVKLAPDLNQNPASPVIGNPDGDVTIVEFFDYRCSYCKRVFPTIQALLKQDGNIRYVLKEFPILGPQSMIATQASLAVWDSAPEKYLDFHSALMTARGQLNEAKIMSVAGKIGLDTDILRMGMKTGVVTDEINKNMELAEILGINGTPAFIVGEKLVPGAISIDELKKLVAAARKG